MTRRRRPARPARRAARRAPPRRGGDASSQQIVFAVVGAVFLLLLIFLFVRGDKHEPAAAPVAEQPRPKPPPDPHADARNKANWWFEERFLDDYARVLDLSDEKVAALFAEGEKRGYDKIPGVEWDRKKRLVYREILRRDPFHPEGNRVFGKIPLSDYPDFWNVFRRMGDHVALPPQYEEFRDELEERIKTKPVLRAPPLTQEEYDKAKLVLDNFQAWDKKLRENPTALKILEARKRVKLDPLLGRYDTVHVEVPPFVLFYAAPGLKPRNSTPLEKQRVKESRERYRQRLESYRKLIEAYLAYFERTWMKPLGLKDFDDEQLFFVWVFGDRSSWEEYGQVSGVIHPPGLLGYFNPRDHWVYLFEDPKERLTVETSLAHEMTHQLHWHFSEDPKSEFKNHLSRIKAVWFQEGWAEYAGWTKKDAAGYKFGQTSAERVRSLRLLQKYGLPLFPLKDLVKREDYREWIRHVLLEWLPKQQLNTKAKPEELVAVFLEVLYAQSWLLVSFLYEYDNGKYRRKALKFTEASLKGYLGYRGARGYARAHEVFGQIFGLRTDSDWRRLQKEYERYMEDKFYEVR